MAARLDTAAEILEMVPAYGFQPGGTFHLDDGSYEDALARAMYGRGGSLRPLLVHAVQVVYTEPGTGRELACAAFGWDDVAAEVVAILNGHLTAPNLGGYSATSRIPLWSTRGSGCYYVDQDGNTWGSMSSERVTPCALCGRPTCGGYIAAMTDVLVCTDCVVHLDDDPAHRAFDAYDDDVVAAWAADAQDRTRAYAVYGPNVETPDHDDQVVLAEWRRRCAEGRIRRAPLGDR
jgi:hypothetical protein